MRCTANCKLGETLEHSVSSVLEAYVSGVVLPRTTHVGCMDLKKLFKETKVYPIFFRVTKVATEMP